MSDETKVTRKKDYVPTDDDYDLCRIGIEEAENGVAIKCGYKLKDSVRDKLKKQEANGGKGPYAFCGYGDDEETHVFETKQKALAFITNELTSMWGE